jgi:hypothetical protein
VYIHFCALTFGDPTLDTMADVEVQAAAAAAPRNHEVQLPPFWPANTASWFRAVEGKFLLRGIEDERVKFYNVLYALPEATVVRIADLVEQDPLPADCYEALKRRLLAAHQLNDMQRVEQLHNLPPLGGQKPSELLSEMLRLCPRGQENNAFFNCLFLNKLPRELRVLLARIDMADKQEVAAQADQLWAHYSKLAHDSHTVAAVAPQPDSEEDEATVAAVKKGPGKGASSRGSRGGGKQGRQKKKKQTPDQLAWQASGLCYKHFRNGEDAHSCEPGCAWQGN